MIILIEFLYQHYQILNKVLMNIFNKLQQQYDHLWKYIIRPTRAVYPEKDLGPQQFELQGKKVKRIDFQFINPRGYLLFASHFVPIEQQNYPCVIYMHGNSSNRTQGMEYLGYLIRKNISLCTFDFSGCGNSEGDYISLGYYEQEDLNQIVEIIRRKKEVTKIALWGRSMGAVTGLLYLRKSQFITCAIFDSPFKSLKSLTQDLCKKNSKIPMFILAGALKIISGTIQEKAKFDIYKLNPMKYQVPFLRYPAMFIVGTEDDMIPPQHTYQLFQAYKGKNKILKKVKGNHNDSRPEQCVLAVLQFLQKSFKQKQVQVNENSYSKKQSTKNSDIKVDVKKQIDFFADEYEDIDDEEIKNSSSTRQQNVQSIDFFSQDFQIKHQKQISQYTKKQGTSDSFSFSNMLSNVFSGQPKAKPTKQKKKDGYQNSVKVISKQFRIDESVKSKKSNKKQKKIKEKQVKEFANGLDAAHQKKFQVEIMANLSTWAY